MRKYLSLLLIFLWSCNNQPSVKTDSVTSENGTTTMRFGAALSAQTLNVIPNADDSIITLTVGHIPHVKIIVVPPIVTPPKDTTPVVIPPATGTRNNLLLENTFDDGKLTGFTLVNEQYCIPCGYALNVVTSPDGKGKSVKYDLKSTDPIVSSSKRSEMQLSGADAPETSERWYGLKYWLEKYDADNGRESILQWHDQDGTTPPLSLQVGSGTFTIMQSFTSGNIPTDIGSTVTGKWISIVIHVKWTTGNTGLLEVWKDGNKVVNKVNVRTNSKGGSYMKIGINKWSWAPGGGSSTATERIFYIDDFRMGNEKATYNDVAP